MRDEERKTIDETEAALALSVFLTNLLPAAVSGAIVWIIYAAIAENHGLYILRGIGLPDAS